MNAARTELAEAVAWCGALPVPLGHSCPLTPAPDTDETPTPRPAPTRTTPEEGQ